MIVYFLKEAENSFASLLILQPQKGKIKLLKFAVKVHQWTLIKSHIINEPHISQLHVFGRLVGGTIMHQVFSIENAAIQVPNCSIVSSVEYDIGGVFLSQNA